MAITQQDIEKRLAPLLSPAPLIYPDVQEGPSRFSALTAAMRRTFGGEKFEEVDVDSDSSDEDKAPEEGRALSTVSNEQPSDEYELTEERRALPDVSDVQCSDEHEAQQMRDAYRHVLIGARKPDAYRSEEHELDKIPLKFAQKELWPHQRAAVARMLITLETLGACLLAYEMGLGKSLIVLVLIKMLGLGTKAQCTPILLIVPLSLLSDWHHYFTNGTGKPLNVCIYHNGRLKKGQQVETTTTDHSIKELLTFDVVITTYDTVRIEHLRKVETTTAWREWHVKRLPFNLPKRTHYPLYVIDWSYLILDEAHAISNAKTQTHIAVCDLPSIRRIAVTGTPLQNSYSDVQAMLEFLRISPWSSQRIFDKYFTKKKSQKNDDSDFVLSAVLAATMASCSQRLKTDDTFDGEPVAKFQKPVMTTEYCNMSHEQERYQDRVKHIWDEVEAARQRELRTANRGNYVAPLAPKETLPAILAARLALVHEDCPSAGYGDAGLDDGIDEDDGQDVELFAERLTNIESSSKCDAKTAKENREIFREKIKSSWVTSPRMFTLREVLEELTQKRKTTKTLVFSEFLCALDVVDAALTATGYKVLRFDGWTPTNERNEALDEFKKSTENVILLVTSKAGGAGLNIQEANVVIILTPAWNPVTEARCIARTVRPGQVDVVDVVELHTHNSIERHVQSKVEEKKKKASQVLDPDHGIKSLVTEMQTWDEQQFSEIMKEALDIAT